MSHVIQWDLSWLRWPDQCRMISDDDAYRPGRVLELTILIEVWLHPEEEPRSRLMRVVVTISIFYLLVLEIQG